VSTPRRAPSMSAVVAGWFANPLCELAHTGQCVSGVAGHQIAGQLLCPWTVTDLLWRVTLGGLRCELVPGNWSRGQPPEQDVLQGVGHAVCRGRPSRWDEATSSVDTRTEVLNRSATPAATAALPASRSRRRIASLPSSDSVVRLAPSASLVDVAARTSSGGIPYTSANRRSSLRSHVRRGRVSIRLSIEAEYPVNSPASARWLAIVSTHYVNWRMISSLLLGDDPWHGRRVFRTTVKESCR
jgi:hypothetical protein